MRMTPATPDGPGFMERTLQMGVIAFILILIGSCSTAPVRRQAPVDRPPLHEPLASKEKTEPSHRAPYWYRDGRMAPSEETAPETRIEPPESILPPGINEEHPRLEEPVEAPERLVDDLDRESLRRVIQNQIAVMENTDLSREERLGDLVVTRGWLKESLESFLELLDRNLPMPEFEHRLKEHFMFYRAGAGAGKKMNFTGYYTPVIDASLVPTPEYRYPLYTLPDGGPGLQYIGYDRSIDRLASSRAGGVQILHYTRREIDGEGVLKDRGLEIAWLKDDLDRYFLHVQGSGVLRFPDGSTQGIRYAGANKYHYTGIGKLMIRDGAIPIDQGSMQGIKQYLRAHPQEIPKYFYQNQRYIFFSFDDRGPVGSAGSEVVGGRTIATDKSVYPAGGLAFIKLRKPVLNGQNEIRGWELVSRFVVDHDTGNAIRGPGRADLYFGVGEGPAMQAGHFHEMGEIYYLIKKL